MSPILIFIIVVVFGTAIWMDHKRKRLGDTLASGALSRAARQTRLDGKEKGGRWGAGG